MNKSMFVNTFYRPVFLLQMPIRYISLFLISFSHGICIPLLRGYLPRPGSQTRAPRQKGSEMPKIPVEQLKAGMKLGRPLMNSSGMVLMAEGTELTESRISKIENMGVDSVFIDGPSRPAKPKEDLLDALERRFARTAGNPQMSLIKKAVREHIEAMYE